MRTLIFSLSFLLMLAPAQGQQAVRQSKPDFYVPYGVRGLPVAAIQEPSSSDAYFGQPDRVAVAMPNPIPRRYPVRGPRFRPHGTRYGMNPQPEFSTTEALIILGIVGLCAGEAISRQ